MCVPKREREGERVVDIPQFNGPLDRQVSAIKMLTPHVRVIWNTLYSIWNNDGQGGDGGGARGASPVVHPASGHQCCKPSLP